MREDEQIKVTYNVADSLTAPVEPGVTVGTIEYMVGDTVYKQESIVTVESVGAIDLEWCMRQILKRFFLFPIKI